MSARVWSSVLNSCFILMFVHVTAPDADAQPPPADERHDMQHDMQHMHMASEEMTMPVRREASGTAPVDEPERQRAVHAQAGAWTLMMHGNAFVQYMHEGGDRGTDQAGSINWIMGMAYRSAAAGRLGLRGMVSVEPWTIRGCGYPDLLASGELCKGEVIHDQQHPHDLIMELAATYDRPLAGDVRWQIYGGPAGEPALGPAAFAHRISAMPNPLAPIAHHWFEATHISYGVVTGGVYGKRWKAETSVFNGREPDEHRTNFDFGALDSWSGRVWFLPTKRWALQLSTGELTEAEPSHDGGARLDVHRTTASATYHQAPGIGSIWATTFGWGRDQEPGSQGTNALLAETSLTLDERDSWFGRFELSQKSGHDLAIESNEIFTVAKLQAGYTRYLSAWRDLRPGVGAGLSAGFVPASLKPFYGGRATFGFAVFVTLRPADMSM